MSRPTPELRPATYKCFDCGDETTSQAGSKTFVGGCQRCEMGMLLVYTFDGEPCNRGYFPDEDPKTDPVTTD